MSRPKSYKSRTTLPPAQLEAYRWFVALCEQVQPTTQSVGQVRAAAYLQGLASRQQVEDNAEFLAGDWQARSEWRSGKRLLRQADDAQTPASPVLSQT